MSAKIELLTPVGRIVQGSLYEPKTTDAEGNPLVYKNGVNEGQPRTEFFFSLALPKTGETHWNQTKWGREIWELGHASFPNGQANSPQFAWKITDGDSQIPNRKGRKPCEREGYPGHWVLNLSSSFAPRIFNSDGTQQLLEPNHVNLGDYVQVYGNVTSNGASQQPGMFLNHQMVAFAGYGKRIILGVDPKSVGFGNVALPAGASLTPLAHNFNPAPVASLPPTVGTATSPAYLPPVGNSQPGYMVPPASTSAPVQPPVVPHYGILNPPIPPVAPPATPAKVLTAKANGATYEQFIANGWTDQMLQQHGYL